MPQNGVSNVFCGGRKKPTLFTRSHKFAMIRVNLIISVWGVEHHFSSSFLRRGFLCISAASPLWMLAELFIYCILCVVRLFSHGKLMPF